MSKNIALITGVTGQDGSYLSEFLLEKGYEVHGIIRRSSVDFRERIAHLEGMPNFHLHYADMGDSMSLVKLVGKVKPTEIYNLAAQSHVQVSFDAPEFTADVDAVGVLRILEAVRTNHLEKTCKIYQASTSELYGKVEEVPQNENTPFHPYSPYAVAKLYGYWIIKEYREAYNMFCGGELGHTVIEYNGRPCSCGRKGCFEAYSSATALINFTKEAMEADKDTKMWEIAGGKIENVDGKTAFDGMRAGDKKAKEVVDTYINYLGCGLTNVVNIFQPELLLIGGGICKEGENLKKPLLEYIARESYCIDPKASTKLDIAKLGNDAGIIGAAYLYTLK